ncbi:phosphoribosylanthranilate isomerase [Caldibacillus lycopersici]|uniref:N-(5'-phosphoribosyl)anthranilate isomerase n=1 Tax=Perspicuibacillus lycopersici TaxID=1325689 RepID=A0AAE3LLR6_9BACI|nr:phosphoribosylanthranilate isomerase [Perspicuibacillus lycopersici]MCU9612027.1 phosphoribosylanthranilate isomerase [Perspicuibacillus lycopersici]
MKVKICGITDLPTAIYAASIGADALGFVFANSKRKITPEAAKAIIEELPNNVMKIGVFVNESKQAIDQIAEFAGLSAIQLHGDETPAFCKQFSLPVIKAKSIETMDDLFTIRAYPCEYILFDSPKGAFRGGNGKTFDWNVVNHFSAPEKKVILAGGLNAENVQDAIGKINPYMVDVSSGVESDGKKDLQKIKQFISKAKTINSEGIR